MGSPMKRIINEATADKVRRDTGFKVGDFGTGGRTYVNNRHRRPNSFSRHQYEDDSGPEEEEGLSSSRSSRKSARGGSGRTARGHSAHDWCFCCSSLIAIAFVLYGEHQLNLTTGVLNEAGSSALSLGSDLSLQGGVNSGV